MTDTNTPDRMGELQEWHPMSEKMIEAAWQAMAADPRTASFSAFNWFVAGVTTSETMQRLLAGARAADEPGQAT